MFILSRPYSFRRSHSSGEFGALVHGTDLACTFARAVGGSVDCDSGRGIDWSGSSPELCEFTLGEGGTVGWSRSSGDGAEHLCTLLTGRLETALGARECGSIDLIGASGS
jgi:hypothetical protein